MTDNLKGFHRVDVKDAVDFKGNPKANRTVLTFLAAFTHFSSTDLTDSVKTFGEGNHSVIYGSSS